MVVGSEIIRFFRENGWLATALKRDACGRSNNGGKSLRMTDGGGMLVGGASFTEGGVFKTPSALSQAQASASIPVVGLGDTIAGVSGGKSANSPHSSSSGFGAGESWYGSGCGGTKFGQAVTGDTVFGLESFLIDESCFVAIIGPKSPNGFLS